GLATAALAQAAGLRVALLEAHTRLGGCAGYFPMGPFTFDAGATALMGLRPGEPIGDLLALLGLDFAAETTPRFRLHLPGRDFHLVADPPAFERAVESAFPGRSSAKKLFWRLQHAVGSLLFAAAGRVPRLPIGSPGDLLYDLRILGVSGLL